MSQTSPLLPRFFLFNGAHSSISARAVAGQQSIWFGGVCVLFGCMLLGVACRRYPRDQMGHRRYRLEDEPTSTVNVDLGDSAELGPVDNRQRQVH